MKVKKPTPEQIATEVARLKAVQPRVPEYSLFGDDNRAAIDAQIKVLEDGMSLDGIYEAFGEDNVEREFSQNTLDCAITTHDWMDGALAEDEGSPAFGWEAIAK